MNNSPTDLLCTKLSLRRLCYERGNPVGLGRVWTAFDRVPIKVRALLSGSRHFANVASFVDLAKGFVHLQGYLAHKRQRPPRTRRQDYA